MTNPEQKKKKFQFPPEYLEQARINGAAGGKTAWAKMSPEQKAEKIKKLNAPRAAKVQERARNKALNNG